MDQKTVAFARSWARHYVRTKHPHGLDEKDVENRILESLYKYGRGNFHGITDPNADPTIRLALSEALNDIQDEGRRNLRALFPWQVRNAEPHLETRAYGNLARDMRNMRIRQRVRENDRRRVRLVLKTLSPEDRHLAEEFMAIGSWRKVAASRRVAWSTFRYAELSGFVARFKEAWKKFC